MITPNHERSVFGTMDDPQFPGRIADVIQAVLGLSNIVRLHSMLIASPVPLSSSSPTGFSPSQIATAYDWPYITDTANGSGVTIAIATADSAGLQSSDYNYFWSYYNLPSHTVNVINVDGTPTATDGDDETTLDIERSGAMAPGAATIDVYDGVNATPAVFADIYSDIVNANTAQVVSTSWGSAESEQPGQGQPGYWSTVNGYFEQGAAEGITLVAAAGDEGSSDGTSNSDEADFPSSSPYVVAAGGTTLTLNGNNTIASETAWSYTYYSYFNKYLGTGGAQSSFFSEPSWQTGNGVPQNGVRNTSDIAMGADPNTPYSFYWGGAWQI